MKRATQISLKLVALLLSFSLFYSAAAAETLNCTTITSLPMTITKQGVYCLQKKLKVNIDSGAAINIQANNVIVDMNGYTIVNTSKSKNDNSNGFTMYNRAFCTIKNGVIRGFATAVYIPMTQFVPGKAPSRGHVLEDLKIEKSLGQAIWIQGDDHTVRNNSITTVEPFCDPVTGCEATGIQVAGGTNVRILNNSIANVRAAGSGNAIAIRMYAVYDAFVANNRISDTSVAIKFDPASTGKYRDNLTSDVSGVAFIGGTNAGNNN